MKGSESVEVFWGRKSLAGGSGTHSSITDAKTMIDPSTRPPSQISVVFPIRSVPVRLCKLKVDCNILVTSDSELRLGLEVKMNCE